jgi:hypothetical protein
MEINAVGGGAYVLGRSESGSARMKQIFEEIGKALDSGNLEAAKAALGKLQNSTPDRTESEGGPMAKRMEELSEAVESGNLEAAQSAFEGIRESKPPHGPKQLQHGEWPAELSLLDTWA